MSNAVDITNLMGKQIGNVIILKEVERGKYNERRVLCKCLLCDTEFITRLDSVRAKNHIKSCRRCASQTTIKDAIDATRKHGEANLSNHNHTKLYGVWCAMKRRCNNPNSRYYKEYGGRGITYCAEWEEYIPFRNWANTNGYDENLTLDRIDTNGNYEPSNCRWTDWKIQQNNRRNNIHIISPEGKEYTMLQLADFTGIKVSTLYERRRKNKNITWEELTKPLP